MKRIIHILLVICIGTSLNSFGQNTSADCVYEVDTLTGETVYTSVDSMPSPLKGNKELMNELKDLQYTTDPVSWETKIYVAFIINENGELTGKRILKNIDGTDLAEQVLTLVDNVEWKPGKCNGSPVPVLYKLPVILELKK